ncbi:MAG TPA: CpsD/CapB family tyrosine-protein kinase [Terracidiphilus sp.]|nr:CpsD/CapB family tyrosine-protein kinase [Terracidiphilus sp.]
MSVPDDIHIAEPRITPITQEQPVAKAELVLENIAEYSWKPSINSFPTLADRGAGVEQFRSLRSHIYQARYDAPLKTILIASGMPSEGKSFVAANLAMSLARNSIHNILLIDGDLRRPTLHTLLGAPNSPGLSNYLEGTAEMNDIMQRDRISGTAENASVGSISNLTFIPSGGSSDHSSELVANQRMEELITAVSPHFDWILIDAPPVLAVTDAVELSRAADAVLLVARGSTTPYDVAQRAKAAFGTSRILGFVLNAVKDAPRKGSYNYYYSGEPEAGDNGKRR